jgi:hypothetical protein
VAVRPRSRRAGKSKAERAAAFNAAMQRFSEDEDQPAPAPR